MPKRPRIIENTRTLLRAIGAQQLSTPVPDGLYAAAAVMSGQLGIKGAGRAYPDPGQHACRTNPECYGARSGKAPGEKACRAAGRNRQTVDRSEERRVGKECRSRWS